MPNTNSKMQNFRLRKFFLTGFGSGWLPVAPGTWGSAVAILMAWPLALLPAQWSTISLMALILVFLWIGVTSSHLVADEWGKDPKQTVIDEMIGIWITLLGIPLTWPYLLAAFVLFRIFDIAKPLGIRQLEPMGNGWGVMLDDVLAGVYANFVLQVVLLLQLHG
jgi:phosphatidylglycerophosphatase A